MTSIWPEIGKQKARTLLAGGTGIRWVECNNVDLWYTLVSTSFHPSPRSSSFISSSLSSSERGHQLTTAMNHDSTLMQYLRPLYTFGALGTPDRDQLNGNHAFAEHIHGIYQQYGPDAAIDAVTDLVHEYPDYAADVPRRRFIHPIKCWLSNRRSS